MKILRKVLMRLPRLYEIILIRNKTIIMKHISIRVPWHDNKWNGTICQCPKNNPFCMMLHNISEKKDEKKEETYAGKDWNSL